jgi:hypothetical protein
MLVDGAVGLPHSCGSMAPMGPRRSKNSSLAHRRDRNTEVPLQDKAKLESAGSAPAAPHPFSLVADFLHQGQL